MRHTLLCALDYTYRERHGEAIYRYKACPREGGGRHAAERLLPPQPRIGVRGRLRLKLPGGRHRHSPARRDRCRQHDVGLGLSHSESTFPQSRKILAEILAGLPDDEQAKPAPDHDPGIVGGNTARVYNFEMAKLTGPA